MRHIDLKGRTPDQKWLKTSDRLTKELIALHEAGDIAARNKLIDDNQKHWGQLKKWLLARSFNKCWFSESRDNYSHLDVEHFRPKKEAKNLDGAQRDGYWWLAFDYLNFRACGNVGNRKKGGFFPLKDTSPVSTYNGRCEETETPYLLDPLDEEDVKLLAFDEEGKAVSAPSNSPWESERVEETVKRMKLNEHEPLTEERRKVWQRCAQEIDRYRTAKTKAAMGINPAAKVSAANHARNIRAMVRPQAEFSAVAVWCVSLSLDPHLSRLLQT